MKANNLPTVKVSEIDHLEAGRYIRGLRTRALMSLRRLSHELGVSAPFLSDLELGLCFLSTDSVYLVIGCLVIGTNDDGHGLWIPHGLTR